MPSHARPRARSLFITRAVLITLLFISSVTAAMFAAVSASGPRNSLVEISQAEPQLQKQQQSNLPVSFRAERLFVNAPLASLCVNPGGTGGCFSTIQAAVNAASSGDTINIAAGSYPEQVTISKSLTIVGAGTATTMLTTPASLVGGIGGNLVLLQIDTAANVQVSGITIAGPRIFGGCSAQIFYGIYVAGAAILNLHDAAVTDIRLQDPALAGCQDGIAVRAGSQALGQTATLTVNNSNITGYQKSAVIVDGTGSTGTITNNILTGLGQANTAENAIQISRSAAATISGNTITGNECSNTVCGPDPLTQQFGNGILIFSTNGVVQVTNNTISNNDTGVYNNDLNATISGNTMVGNRFNGIFLDEGNATVSGNKLSGPMNVGIIATSFNGNGGNSTGTLTGNTITGAGIGLQLLDETGADAFVPQMTAHFNRIVATTTAINNAQNQTVNFENNWWGCNAGPANAGCGAVSGAGADFNPWFVLAASATPNSINAGSTSNVAADMTHNSDGAVPGTALPNLPVGFSATNGTMNPTSGTVIAGAASSIFTSTNNNSSVVTVTVDNQNLNVPITVIPAPVTVTPAITPTAGDNDYTRINNAIQAALAGQTIKLNGAFNWAEANAAVSWAKGSDGVPSNGDDYEILVPANLNNVTLTANNLGDATIQGPGDLPAVNLEAFLVFDSSLSGASQGWTISNLRIQDFDLSIGMFAVGVSDYNNTHITNNYIRIAKDLNATVAPADVNQNIGIHFSFGTNEVISGNTIEIQGDGVSDSANSNFATDVGMQSNTSGGSVYNGLQITSNIIRVLNAQSADPQVILGIWENAHGHTSNITVSGNQFINQAVGNNPATNLQRGFRVTSHSSATTTVTYSNNTVTGANIGFQWLAGSNFAGNQPVKLTSNTILNGSTGVLVQSQGLANLSFNRIVGNSVAGTNNVDGIVTAENNWWGCNAGPGNTGCNSVLNGSGTIDFNPWLQLRITAAPSTILPGGTSTATADMTHNSDNAVPSAVVFVPPTAVTFGATQGTMAPPSGTLSSGQAASTFTSTSASSGSASATVDNQTISTPITVSAPPTFTIDDVTHNEGNSGTTAYTFTVTKTNSTALNASVDYATVNGTATAPSDFTAIPATTLTFLPADTTKQFTVLVNGDTTAEPDETFSVHLSNPVNATISDADGAAVITNDDTDISVAVSPASVAEDGVTNLVYTFTRNGITTGALTVNFSVGGTATFATDYTQSGAATFAATSGTVAFGAGTSTATVTIDPTPDVLFEPNETVILTVTSGTGYNVASPSAATGTINNDDAAGGIIRFSSATYNTTESSGVITITVQRAGDISAAATVDYTTPDDSDAITVTPCATINGLASPRCDFTTAIGTLRWAAGDGAAKTFNVLISQDNYVEGPETLTLTLSNLTGGAVFGVPSTATLTIADDATEAAANPIDDASNFVRQQYHDFLNREPDASGLAFWTNEITSCGSNQQCIDFKRVQVSAAFYISIEFQDTGYLVERLYKASYGDVNGISTLGGSHTLKVPIVRFSEFLPDTQEIGLGVVVGAPGWPQALEANKVAFADKFVQRARFTAAYANTLTPAQFVDALFANAGVVPTAAERQAAIDEFGGAGTSANTSARARALRRVAENGTLTQQEFNRAFVLMQYFGYLRRNPNSAPDADYTGFDFWLTKLNQFNGNFQNADMVKSFLVSTEYRRRFGTP